MGGDYYDFLELPEGRLGLAIGDVSGKGVGAALMMASLEASLRALAPVVEDPAELMERVNNLVLRPPPPAAMQHSSTVSTILQPDSLQYVNAGHNPPVVLRQRRTAVRSSAP